MRTPILDYLIFKKMRALVGGRIRLLLSGGAPLSPDTHDFVRNALSLPLVQGRSTKCNAKVWSGNSYFLLLKFLQKCC